MATPVISDAELIKVMQALDKAHGIKLNAARALGLSESTFRSRYNAAIRRKITAKSTPRDASDTSLDTRARDDQVLHLRATVADLQRRLILDSRWKRQFDSLDSIGTGPINKWLPSPAIKKQASEHILQLFTSDFQCGEKINLNEIDGINEYNANIFVERYQRLINTTIDLAENHMGKATFPGVIYLAGGDAISGEIHDELAQTNDLSSIPAVRLLCQQERDGIRRLRDKFGRVRVYRIPGNHGRTTMKPRSKQYTDRNYETLLSWWLASTFDDDPKVEFFIPASGDAYYEALGWRFLMSHGDRMGSRGGQGFIGPSATISRGHTKLHANYAATGRPVDIVLTGHLHTELKLERGLANGALAGYSEYARDLRATPDAARQWLFATHRDRPLAHLFSIQLSPMPKRRGPDLIG